MLDLYWCSFTHVLACFSFARLQVIDAAMPAAALGASSVVPMHTGLSFWSGRGDTAVAKLRLPQVRQVDELCQADTWFPCNPMKIDMVLGHVWIRVFHSDFSCIHPVLSCGG